MRKMLALKISDPKKIEACASPVRLAIIDALESASPLSVASLARRIGDTADGLYYHLRILEKNRIITKKGELVHLFRPIVQLTYKTGDVRNRNAVVRVAGSILRTAYRCFAGAFKPGIRVTGRRRELWVGQRAARLTPSQLERVNRLLWEILKTFQEGPADDPKNAVYVLTFSLSPYRK